MVRGRFFSGWGGVRLRIPVCACLCKFAQRLFHADADPQALYFLLRVVYCWDSFGKGHFFALLVFNGISYFTLNMMLSIAEEGNNYSVYQDILYVNLGVQICTIFTEWGFLLYLSIPGYLFYQHGSTIWNILSSLIFGGGRRGADDQEGEPQLSEQDLKRQKRAERRRVKTFRS